MNNTILDNAKIKKALSKERTFIMKKDDVYYLTDGYFIVKQDNFTGSLLTEIIKRFKQLPIEGQGLEALKIKGGYDVEEMEESKINGLTEIIDKDGYITDMNVITDTSIIQIGSEALIHLYDIGDREYVGLDQKYVDIVKDSNMIEFRQPRKGSTLPIHVTYRGEKNVAVILPIRFDPNSYISR